MNRPLDLFAPNVKNLFGALASTRTSFWDCNPFLGRLAWLIKNSKQYNESNITSDSTSFMLTHSVNGPFKPCECEVDLRT